MKLKHKRIPFFFGLLILVSTVLASFAPIFEGHASAADEFGCTYTYGNVDQSVIKRAGCQQGGLADANYALTNTGGQVYEAWTLSEGGCDSTILIQNKGGDLQLNGKVKTSSGCQAVAGGTVITVEAGASDQNTQDAATRKLAYVAYLKDSLQSLIDAHCAANEKNGAPTNCSDAYYTAISTCVDKVLPKITSDDKDPNQKFLDLFSACMINELPNSNLKKKDITSLLGSNVYDDLIATGDAAINTGSTGDGGDACNASGHPLTWILCPIFDGAGSLSDAILNSILKDFLQTDPISIDSGGTVYKIWSSFRIWGNIFLVIALLVIVFGESISGGLIDAYTAKKVLPRILIAAMLINTSIYIVALLVDFTNILGQAIGNIITAPLNGVSVSPSGFKLGLFAGAGALGGITIGIVGYLLGAALVGGIVLGFMPMLLLFIILPTLLAIFMVFLTLVFRKALILALVLISPVAFALYCLPNTEKYFRQWWDLLFKTLMIYPIVMVVFAVSDVLAYTSISANGTNSFWGYLVAFLLQFMPLFLIPFSFKIAGGVIGQIHTFGSGLGKRGMEGIKGNANDPWSRRNRAKRSAGNQFLTARESLVGTGVALQKQGGRGKRFGRALSGIAGMGNYEELRSRRNKEGSEMHAGQVMTGADNTSRALFARKLEYMHDTGKVDAGGGKVMERRQGWFGTQARVDDNGLVIGQNAPQFADSEVQKARSLYGSDPSLYQPALTYEIGKASDDDDLDTVLAVHQANMNDGGRFADPGKDGIWGGSKFAVQNSRKELKHTTETKDSSGRRTGFKRKATPFTREIAQTIGTYPLSNMRTSTIKALREDHDAALAFTRMHDQSLSAADRTAAQQQFQAIKSNGNTDVGDGDQALALAQAQEVLVNTRATAGTLNQRRQQQGSYGFAQGDDGEQVPGTMSGAAGLVEEELTAFVNSVSTGQGRSGGGGSPPTGGPAPGGGPTGGGGPSGGGGTSPHRYTYP